MFTVGFEKTAAIPGMALFKGLGTAAKATGRQIGMGARLAAGDVANTAKTVSKVTGNSLAGAIGGTAGAVKGQAQAAAKGVKTFAGNQEAKRIVGYKKGLKGADWAPKQGYQPSGVIKPQLNSVQRLQRLRANASTAPKAGFVKRHPYLTAGAAFLGARAMMGQPDQPPPPPQIVQY